jgi:hypothetical protein
MRILYSVLFSLLASISAAAGPRVNIVVGASPPELVRRAAEELATDLKRLYAAEVHVGATIPGGETPVILIGMPESGAHWKGLSEPLPKLSEQGHAVLSRKHQGRPVLVVVGGSPAAAYWGSAELAQQWGARSMLYGDVDPVEPPALTLAGFDVVREPRFEERAWHMDLDSPIGPAVWGLADQQKLLRQLARLKFNRLVLETAHESPAAALSAHGQIVVSGDTAGRSAFGGAKLFENPDLANHADEKSKREAAEKWVVSVTEAAEALGMTVEAKRVPAASQPTAAEGVLPYLDFAAQLSDNNQRHASLDLVNAGDADLAAFSLSRASFDAKAAAHPLNDLVTPICGDGVAERVQKAFEMAAEATKLIAANDPAFGTPNSDVVLRHYDSSEPAPEWWAKANENYLNAMNEMYRANTRAREGGRSYTLYFARRFEFAFEYMNCVAAVRNAGIAKSKQDAKTQIAELEKAVESMNGGLNALAAVARSPSDRAIIAVLNEYGYRPLVKELEAADEAASQ